MESLFPKFFVVNKEQYLSITNKNSDDIAKVVLSEFYILKMINDSFIVNSCEYIIFKINSKTIIQLLIYHFIAHLIFYNIHS